MARKKPVRKFADINQIIKMIHDQPKNWWATVCYAKLIKVRKTMRSLDKDSFANHLNAGRAETNDDVYNGLSDFHSGVSKKLPYVAVFAIKRYQFNWIAGDKWDSKNTEYTQGIKDISRRSLSKILPRKIENPGEGDLRNYMPGGDDEDGSSNYEKLTWGLGGKVGTNGNSKGKSYIPYNRHSYKTLDIEYYGVNEEGHIVGRIPTNIGYMLDQDYDQTTLTKKPDPIMGASGIKRAGATPDELVEYESQCNKLISNLKFLPAHIIEGQVLYMAAAVQKETQTGELEDSGTENEKLVWLNDSITSHFESLDQKTGKYNYNFDVEPADLYAIAIDKINNSYEMQLSSRKRFGKVIKESRQIRLTESELKQVVKHATMKIISEMRLKRKR
jgi:hypothetical protein